MIFTETEAGYLDTQDIGRLATAQPDGTLQANPVGFRRNAELDTIDIGGYAMAASRKFRNLASNERVAFVVDDVVSREPWRVRCVEIRGHAEAISGSDGPWSGTDGAIIRVHPQRIISFGLHDPDLDPHLQKPNARTVATADRDHDHDHDHGGERPILDDPTARAALDEPLSAFVAELQAGLDRHDADLYDRSFASDVLWGSPYGATLGSLDELVDVHRRLMAQQTAPHSRFEVVTVRAPAPGIAIAQIRRQALDHGFSELALYILVRRAGRWWLAAAQNTPISTPPR